jgi:hypothetical protein
MVGSLQVQTKVISLRLLIKCLDVFLFFSIIGEIIFFPSGENLAGCGMALVAWLIFRKFLLKKRIILEHPFSFFAYLSLFVACFTPLPSTLIEAKPITYGFQNSYETFFYQTLLFIVVSLAFFFVSNKKKTQNNALQRALYRNNFFNTNPIFLWTLGLIGSLARIQNLVVANEVQLGDAGSKFLDGFLYLQVAPLIMLFPTLSRVPFSKSRSKILWLYLALMIVISFATNSRQQMIYPIFTIFLLFLLYILKENISIFSLFSPTKIFLTLFFVFYGLGLLSDISLAMLENRVLRADISRLELFETTLATIQDEKKMEVLRNNSLENQGTKVPYATRWDETYLNNFMINRYANVRVVDQTIYYANKIGFANAKMQETFWDKTLAIYPLPVITALGINIEKKKLAFSPGDMLYAIGTGETDALGGFRVTSLVGDGLATFGYWCFPIIFLLFFFSFRLMDNLVFFTKTGVIFSTLGLINIFGFLGMFRNSIGCIIPMNYILRGFWQQCFTFWLLVFILGKIFGLKKQRNSTNRF